MKKDSLITGLLSGIIAPLFGFYLYFLLFFGYMGFNGFVKHVIKNNLAISVLSLGVILNLVIFFAFYKFELDRSAKGVIFATFLYSFVVVYFKVL